MKIFYNAIPVIAYHQIGSNSKITPDIFEQQVKHLYENGYKTVTLDEFYFYITGKKEILGKKILITFDDGFTDNLVYAYPILKKYGFNAVIFLITSRVTISDEVRYDHDDLANGRCEKGDIYETNWSTKANTDAAIFGNTKDFLTSAEIKKMYDDGTMDFQSHTHLHAKYFSDSKVVSFFDPRSHWAVLFETLGKYDYGIPVYNMSSAICKRRFFDDRNLRESLIEYVNKSGGSEFFNKKDYKKILFNKVAEFKAKSSLNERFETDKEYEDRVADDLMRSKEIIRQILNKEPKYLCLPWGESSESAVKIAKGCGFKGIFSLKRGANKTGGDLFDIKRLEVKPKGINWFKKRVSTYSSGIKSNLYNIVRL